jgi:hypothetical protein
MFSAHRWSLKALMNNVMKMMKATKSPHAKIRRGSESPRMMEFPGSDGDKNNRMNTKMELAAPSEQKKRKSPAEFLIFCIENI